MKANDIAQLIAELTNSSSAVAERPRDASCLSVVNLNSTNVEQSFSVSYVDYRFITAWN